MKQSKTEGTRRKRTTERRAGGRGGGRALNPLRHAFFFQGPVIPGVESTREFRRFQSKMVEAFAPRDEFERWLVRRIVSFAWRLNRVEVYETAVIEKGQQSFDKEVAESGEEMGDRLLAMVLKAGPAHLELLKGLAHPAAEARVRGNVVVEMLGVVADLAEVKLEDVVALPSVELTELSEVKLEDVEAQPSVEVTEPSGVKLEDVEAQPSVEVNELSGPPRHPLLKDWTPTEILEAIAAIARRAGYDPEGLRQEAVQSIELALAAGEAQRKAVLAGRDHRRRLRLLPDSDELDRIQRPEAQAWRLLQRALRELEAWRARGRGERGDRLDSGALSDSEFAKRRLTVGRRSI